MSRPAPASSFPQPDAAQPAGGRAAPRRDAESERRGRLRWVVCGLLFLATANNYFDRQVFGVLAPELIRRLHWRPNEYTAVVTAFDVAYGVGFLLSGRLLDAIGTRVGFALSAAAWSVAAAAHGLVASVLGFKLVRALLGLSESAHLPAAIKAVADWFPRRERALATGIYKAGGEIGALTVPVLIPWLYATVGWRWTFALTGATGLAWLGAWLMLYQRPERHRWIGAAELALIREDGPSSGTARRAVVPWPALLRRPETYGYFSAKFLTDAVWHWYLYLLPLFLSQRFGLSLRQFGPPLVAVYALSDGGSIGGGWLSGALMGRGWSVTPARKLAMLVCCCAVLPVVFAPHVSRVWLAVPLVGVAMAAHQGWTSNLFTVVSDLYPQGAIGSIVGVGGACGMAGAALLAAYTGRLLATGAGYSAIFLIAGGVYLIAFALFHLSAPSLEPLALGSGTRPPS